MRILIKDHKDSLESIERDGKIIYMVGPGVLKSPGHPAGNHQHNRQANLFRVASTKPQYFKIFNRDCNGFTEYMGEYSILDYKIKISFEGFRYYEYKMVRVKCSTPGVEPVFPQA
jgi:hypothetical protein